ncbi:MAG: hypothetical protein J6023_04025 [Clostridia bacterium]|nr:hypothetical protein [Clostridia bacterium]
MKKSFSTSYPPYLVLTFFIAVVVTTAVILLGRIEFPQKWLWDLLSTAAILFAVWCVAEIALSYFTFIKIQDGKVIFTKTIFKSRVEFSANAITKCVLKDKTGQVVSGKNTYRNVSLSFEIGSRKESISFSAVSQKKIEKILKALNAAGMPETMPESTHDQTT